MVLFIAVEIARTPPSMSSFIVAYRVLNADHADVNIECLSHGIRAGSATE